MPLKKHRKDSLDIVEIMGTKVAILGLIFFLVSILLLTVAIAARVIEFTFAAGTFLLHVASVIFCVGCVALFTGTMALALAGCATNGMLHKYTHK